MDRPVIEQHFAEALFAEAREGDVFFLLELEKSKKFVRKVPLKKDNYREVLQNLKILPNHHYFITANSYRSGTSHTADALNGLHAIVLDIDCHADAGLAPYARDELLHTLAHLVMHDIADDFCVPLPAVVYTGRGLHLWWFLHRMPSDEDAAWKAAAAKLADVMRNALTVYPAISVSDIRLTIDVGASTAITGDYRLPGTVNPNTGMAVVAAYIPNERYSLEDFDDLVLPEPQEDSPKKEANNKYVGGTPQKNLRRWLQGMVGKIEQLRAIRNADPYYELRNNYCLVYYSLLRGLDMNDEEATRQTERFNDGFKLPLKRSEINSTLCSARNVGGYKFTIPRIAELLEITPEEASLIGLHISTTKKAKPIKEVKARNQRIVAMYTIGLHQQKIADTFGISAKTVSKVIANYRAQAGIQGSTRAQRDKLIDELSRQGVPVTKIAEKVGYSTRTVQYVRSKHPDSKGCKKSTKGAKNLPTPIIMGGNPMQQGVPQLEETTQTRNHRIIEMYEGGTPQKCIADALGISTKTVSKTIVNYRAQTSNPDLKHSQRDDRILELSRQGVSVAKIAEEVGCSTRTVQYVRSKQPDSKGCKKSTKGAKNLPTPIIMGGNLAEQHGIPSENDASNGERLENSVTRETDAPVKQPAPVLQSQRNPPGIARLEEELWRRYGAELGPQLFAERFAGVVDRRIGGITIRNVEKCFQGEMTAQADRLWRIVLGIKKGE